MLIRATSKLLTISRISAERCDSLPAEGFPGEWYANLLSTGRRGGSAIHFLHNPTMVSVFVPGKSLRTAIGELPGRLDGLLVRNGFAHLFHAFQADTDCTIYATSSRSLLAVMSQMGISIESAFWDLRDSVGWDPDWDPADSDFVSLENRYLDYLIGGQTAKQRGEMYVSARELLEHLAVPGHLLGHLAGHLGGHLTTVFGK